VRTLTGHNGPVLTVIQLRDGRLVSGSADGTMVVWNDVIQVPGIKVPEFQRNNNTVFNKINKYVKRFTCSICLENEINLLLNPCGHPYCKNCIDKWLNKNASCPLCRKKIESVTNINLGSLNSSFNKI
jgi:WD40 repeat protein